MPISANHALHHLRPLHSEWGLSLLLEPQRGDEKRTFLLDFGGRPRSSKSGINRTWCRGTKRTCRYVLAMSALGGETDIPL
jgi:hypothetical protein